MQTWIVGLACVLLLSIVLYEMLKSQPYEGFEDTKGYFEKFYPKRSDIVPGQTMEPDKWIRDIRYKEQYVDVQKIGEKSDFCRVIAKEGNPGSMILACALAGTEGMSSTSYSTKSKAEGFKFSRDDYFRDINDDLRDDYCRIVKISQSPNERWDSLCVIAAIDRFKPMDVRDPDPPQEIVELLWFFEGIMIWYRFKDDLLDYAENTQLGLNGNITIDEDPTKPKSYGLAINKYIEGGQFIRIGENKNLEFDSIVELRNLRAFCFWVHFDKFTKNARIFDFGNGAGHENVFFGIEGSGNDTGPQEQLSLDRHPKEADIVCNRTAPKEMAPRQYMVSTESNIELYECPGPEPIDPTTNDTKQKITEGFPKRANLLFEIWDKEQRKMRIKILDAVQEGSWHFIAVTTTDLSMRPTYEFYIDGLKVYSQPDGHLPQTSYTTKNYIGRSNWEDAIEQGPYKDERFRGSLFDFRMYKAPMSESKILKSLSYGKRKLKMDD